MIGPLAALLLVKATLVAGTALAVVRCARGSPAAVRHVLLAAAFAVLLLLPLASVVAPPVQVPLRLATPPMGAATAVEPIARMIGAESTSDEATILPPVPRSFLPSTSAVLLASWFAGVIVFLLPLIADCGRRSRFAGPPFRGAKDKRSPIVSAANAACGTVSRCCATKRCQDR